MTESTATLVHRLHEVIAALDRRAPQPLRSDEATIAQAAAALRREAIARLVELGFAAPAVAP